MTTSSQMSYITDLANRDFYRAQPVLTAAYLDAGGRGPRDFQLSKSGWSKYVYRTLSVEQASDLIDELETLKP